MLFCDLLVSNVPVWNTVPCLNCVPINSRPYLAFAGDLVFFDTQSSNDPDYTGLGGQFALLYFPADGSSAQQVPLQAVPAQQLDVILGGQNCTLSFYTRVSL